jgi:hypothetical protein
MRRASPLQAELVRRYGDSLHEPTFGRLSHDRLMQASRDCLKRASRSEQPDAEIVAMRLTENPRAYQSWEDEHAALMRRVAAERLPAAQRESMLLAAFSLIHRKALFEYLREHGVRGSQRESLIRHFFPQRDVEDSVRAEHAQYLRSAASYLCVGYLGRDLMFDALFAQPLAEYEELYEAYFHAHCDRIIANPDRLSAPPQLISSMKERVSEWRSALLALTHSQSGTWRRPKF